MTAVRVFHFSKVYLKRLRRVCKNEELFERRKIKKEKIGRRFDQINLNAVQSFDSRAVARKSTHAAKSSATDLYPSSFFAPYS